MTEGIIQKVIKTYLHEYPHIDDVLSDLEQALIAEIKKNAVFKTRFSKGIIQLETLIGDSEE